MPDKPPAQVWELTIDGRTHRVETSGSLSHQVRWYVDDELVAEKKAMEDKIRLEAEERPEIGTLAVRFSGLGHGRRATVFLPDDESGIDAAAQALTGLGGIDLDPEPGSKAAAYEEKVRTHPRRYAVLATTVGVAKVVVPIVVALLLARVAFSVPLPDWNLPELPSPDLPELPWPDLPSPNLPDVSVPDWVRWLLDKSKYVVPVLVAIAIAQGEIKRRRKQDQLRAELRAKHSEQRSSDEAGS